MEEDGENVRKMIWLLVAMCGVAAGAQDLKPMPADAVPVFDVATIKPTDPAEQNQGFQTRGRHVKVVNESVLNMIMFAYAIHPKQIIGGPAWMKDHYDVDGVPDVVGDPNLKQMQELVQKLLEDRFGLKIHHEKRELGVYAVTVAKTGAKMEKTKSPDDKIGDQSGNGGAHKQTMVYKANNMDDFALGMQYFMDKPVLNQTGLVGRFDFKLVWNPDPIGEGEADVPGLFTAVQEQLGLRMEATKGTVDVIVVDALEKPSEN